MTEQSWRIVICGVSLFAMAIETSLTRLLDSVTRLDPHVPEAAERIVRLNPDVVLIERNEGQGDLALALLGMGIPLIELDVERKQAVALTGRLLPAIGVADLTQMIAQLVLHSHRTSKKSDIAV